jgi:hypothetical protein
MSALRLDVVLHDEILCDASLTEWYVHECIFEDAWMLADVPRVFVETPHATHTVGHKVEAASKRLERRRNRGTFRTS